MELVLSRCVECGECLVRCRYLDLSRRRAVKEIHKINEGRHSVVHEKCVSCYACNAFCPREANPYERILASWSHRYEEEGLPRRARYLMPTLRPNFRQDLPFSPEERALHAAWGSDDPPADTVLYPGCNLLAMPGLATGPLFEKLPVWGRFEHCCGEMYFRMGLASEAWRVAERLERFYADHPVKKMVFLCPACYNMFTNVLPDNFGARFPFETQFFTDWLTERLDRGELELKTPLTGSVVLHDSCHARILGEDFMERQRVLLRRLGLAVYETEKNRSDGLCCGMAAGATRYSGADILKAGARQLLALQKSPAETSAAYCTGCLLTLSIASTLVPFVKPVTHTLVLVRRALGEEVAVDTYSRSREVLRGTLRHAVPHYFSRSRFRVADEEARAK